MSTPAITVTVVLYGTAVTKSFTVNGEGKPEKIDAPQRPARGQAFIRSYDMPQAAFAESNWEQVTPFFAHPPEVGRIIYPTNAVESLDS